MRNPKKRRKTLLFILASTKAQASFLKLQQNTASESNKPSFWISYIVQAKIVSIRRHLGCSRFFHRAWQMSQEKLDWLLKILKPHLPEKNASDPMETFLLKFCRLFPICFFSCYSATYTNFCWELFECPMHPASSFQVQSNKLRKTPDISSKRWIPADSMLSALIWVQCLGLLLPPLGKVIGHCTSLAIVLVW
jgi:hypothetical protein